MGRSASSYCLLLTTRTVARLLTRYLVGLRSNNGFAVVPTAAPLHAGRFRLLCHAAREVHLLGVYRRHTCVCYLPIRVA